MAAAHSSNVQKPLPSVPPRPHISSIQPKPTTLLTVEAQEHLSDFIKHALEEDLTETARDGWQDALMGALTEMGELVARNGWLVGVRRTRETRTKRRGEKLASAKRVEKEREEKAAKEKDNESRFRSKSKSTAISMMELSTVKEKEQGPKQLEERTRAQTAQAVEQLTHLASQHVDHSSPRPHSEHLLLTVVPPTIRPHVRVPSDYTDVVPFPQGPICTFIPGVYSLPTPGADVDADSIHRVVLYGFSEWDVAHPEDADQLVGGTFDIKGALSQPHHDSLVKVLRIAIYLHLSLLLEQHFLSDSHIELHFPKPLRPVNIPSAAPIVSTKSMDSSRTVSFNDQKRKPRESGSGPSLWNFLSKKTGRLLSRTQSISISSSRPPSLDLVLNPTISPPSSMGRSSEDHSRRERRFSFFGQPRTPSTPPPAPPEEPPFQAALRKIEESKTLLSSSTGVVFVPPVLLARLAEKEKQMPTRRLTGEERTGLTSILGWEGKESRGRGMAGTAGFVRQQRLSVLFSEFVPFLQPPNATPEPSTAESTIVEKPKFRRCGPRAQWKTLGYYGSDSDTLGEAIVDMCGRADDPCERYGCTSPQGLHERRWIHDGVRIVANVQQSETKPEGDDDHDEHVRMWQSCKECNEKTAHCRMNDGTYLFSFPKFIELLIYSPVICTLIPTLCIHTTPPPQPWTSVSTSSSSPSSTVPPSGSDPTLALRGLPASRFNIVRHFSYKSHSVSFIISPIEDIFELRIPRLQIVKGNGADKLVDRDKVGLLTVTQRWDLEGEVEKKELRREIKGWWQEVAEHLDKLELELADPNEEVPSSFRKTLPRLPSADEAYEPMFSPETTPKAGSTSLPSTIPPTPASQGASSYLSAGTIRPSDASISDANSIVTTSQESSRSAESSSSIILLTNMRQTFQKTEQDLYSQIAHTPSSTLNDVRRTFHSSALGALKRLVAWENKHLAKEARTKFAAGRKDMKEPEWWDSKSHAVPGGNVIVREDDWGSIIAFTLSSTDYHRELAGMSLPRGGAPPTGPGNPTTPLKSPSIAASSASSFKFFASPSKPNPDNEDTVWHEPESCSAVISRKEHPRDPSSILSIRDVLRNKAPLDSASGLPASVFTAFGPIAGRNVSGPPPSAWAKPAVEVDRRVADGHVTAVAQSSEKAGKILADMDSASIATNSKASDMESSGFLETNIRRGKASSIMSIESNGTVGPSPVAPVGPSTIEFPSAPLSPPPKDSSESLHQSESPTESNPPSLARANSHADSDIASSPRPMSPTTLTPTSNNGHGSGMSWTSTLTHAMRYMLRQPGDISRPNSPSSFKKHHGLLSGADPLLIDDRPHIKYDWTIGKRLKFSCTVYYAKQFDALRRRCGIDDIFVKSMAECENWLAEGGKSKSNFYKTADDRFIIKTLVNAWNVADLQVLIELGPSYFRYMETTANRASILAKLLGFYTIEVRNLESGTVQAKADLLVMENLFYNQKIGKTFDLKGIQGRKVKANSGASTSKTLFDGEWMEGQERALTLVRPHSKAILQEGIKQDCDFLTKSNIMDYSLLLGINEEKKQIVCGLVDTIGSYTFAKTLEYKAKQGLAGTGKEVTVIPPNEYEDRFVTSMDHYFLACPDKWTKPPDDKKFPHDYTQLPSVL